MSQFFISIMMILFGGFFSLVFAQHSKSTKIITVVLLSAGCLSGVITAVAQLMGTGSDMVAFFEYLNGFSLAFQMDGLSAFFLMAIFGVSLLAAIYSFHYMNQTENSVKIAVNYLFFSFLIAAMALVVTASNIITFMLFWEIMSLSSFFLVIYNYDLPENRKAGFLYFVFSHVGAMFIFAAFGIIYGYTGSFGFGSMAAIPDSAKIVIFIFSFVGFGSKAGVFPFHVWLPHAHPAAPSHISAVMSGVMIKTGIYGIIRMYALLNFHTPIFGNIVLIAGVVSGVLGVVYALGQHDLKRLLAYHSVENIGIILIGLGIGMIGVSSGHPLMAVLGFSGGFLHVLNHAVFKSLLFMGAGMVLHKTGSSSIDALGGLLKSMKITGTTFIIGSLAISGLPPFNGFVSEFLIYMGGFKGVALDESAFVMSIVAIISLAIIGGLALACFTKVVGVVFQGEPRTKAAENVNEKGLTMLVSMSILAGTCILIGIFPWIFIQMSVKAVCALGLDYGNIPLAPFEGMAVNITLAAMIFLVVLLLVIALRWYYYRGKTITRSGTWGCGFTRPTVRMQYTGSSYAAFLLEFFSPVAPLKEDHPPIKGLFPLKTYYRSHVHDIAELHMEKVIVRPLLSLFDKLRWIQHGDIHLYIGYILLAIVSVLFFI
ncbi:proton-conducting transporter transmembrane domain-containing protein [Desulfobacula toluolica]|uniref:HyfB: predicted hydrogenase 4, component B n=1 Tax=Desulfobacula toluolica (strain DSM 7467 / Tol2) TaxID=651182 RepID=K0N894_DESTT|nr:proton-conducting transporter membrane subunit [Desulfobacula toluolica]CCK80109.1 HyfB: predicted hydrogenase 4, component B [Desulfobacula toluolica Tol2]